MSPLDIQLVHRKATLIEKDLQRLQEFAAMSESTLWQMKNTHSWSKVFLFDYYSSFIEISKHGLVDAELAKTLAQAAGLRNVLAHEYDEIDPIKLYSNITLAIKNIPRYLTEILTHIA